MSITLAAFVTLCRADLRDPFSATAEFSDAEIQRLIGEGIDALTSFYPKEVIGTVSIVASTYSYAMPTGVRDPFRVDVYNADGTIFMDEFEEARRGTNSGWEKFSNTLFLPQSSTWATGMTLRVWGYGPWAYIDQSSSSSATTDLDQSALIAVAKYVSYGVYERLCSDRSKFKQMIAHPENTDVQPIALLQYRSAAKQAYEDEKKRLRFLRRNG